MIARCEVLHVAKHQGIRDNNLVMLSMQVHGTKRTYYVSWEIAFPPSLHLHNSDGCFYVHFCVSTLGRPEKIFFQRVVKSIQKPEMSSKKTGFYRRPFWHCQHYKTYSRLYLDSGSWLSRHGL